MVETVRTCARVCVLSCSCNTAVLIQTFTGSDHHDGKGCYPFYHTTTAVGAEDHLPPNAGG